MRVQDFMNENVETVSPNLSADEAKTRMKVKNIHHLVVIDGQSPIGVISERDLGGRRSKADLRGQTTGDLMTSHTVTAKPDTTVRQAANLMRGSSIGCLPIMDRGKLAGIITVSDLLELLGRGLEKPIHQTDRPTLSRRRSREGRGR
ncbi:CBS domain-containing protein, partial [Candidatus Sumerlaeota bacterium]|nr:CBS domain-containing protein [Candidatus Sumerlaeota bacterium]